jgi:hypothetical protein
VPYCKCATPVTGPVNDPLKLNQLNKYFDNTVKYIYGFDDSEFQANYETPLNTNVTIAGGGVNCAISAGAFIGGGCTNYSTNGNTVIVLHTVKDIVYHHVFNVKYNDIMSWI